MYTIEIEFHSLTSESWPFPLKSENQPDYIPGHEKCFLQGLAYLSLKLQ